MGRDLAFGWEVSLMAALQELLGEKAILVLSKLSVFGEEVFLVLIIGLLYWGIDKKFGREVGRIVLLTNVWTTMIKNVVLRRRPYFDHENIRIFRPVKPKADLYDVAAQGFSFPSGHSSNSAATYGAVFRGLPNSTLVKSGESSSEAEAGSKMSFLSQGVVRVIRFLCVLMPVLIGFSRVIIGAHYPTDVLAGWGLGVVCLFFVPFLYERLGELWFSVLVGVFSAVGFFYCKSDDYYTSLGLLIGFLLAVPFEERFVRFADTRNPICIVLRLMGGGLVYLVLNVGLKLPFSEAFLDSGTVAAHLVRSLRYFVIAFIAFGVYPILFNKLDPIFSKKKDLKKG